MASKKPIKKPLQSVEPSAKTSSIVKSKGKKTVILTKEIQELAELYPFQTILSNNPRIQTAEGWKREQLKKSHS